MVGDNRGDKRLKGAKSTQTNASVENHLQKLIDYALRPLADFNEFETLTMVVTATNDSHDTKHQKKVTLAPHTRPCEERLIYRLIISKR